MRRSTKLLIAALSSATLLACEDGPNQTYSPAPAGAGDLQNSSFDPAKTPVIDPSLTSLAGDPGKGSSRQEICDADTKRLTWAKAIASKIEPPRKYGGIDMAGDDTWRGITVEQADQINCQSVSDGNGGVHWGDNSEIQFFYDIGTHVVTQMVLNLGYSGKIQVKGRKPNSGQDCYNYAAVDNKGAPAVALDPTCPHQNDLYEIGVGGLPLKNNAPWLFDPNAPDFDPKITEFEDAVIASYMPDQASAPSCGENGGCLELPDDGTGNVIWGIRPAAVYFVTHAHTAQPVLSTPYYIYNFFIKILPYSNAPMTVKIDAEGPFAKTVLGTGANQKTCNIKLGQTWADMLSTCVNITGDPTLDKQNFNKLVGGRIHTLDDIFFNVVGVNQNVTLQKDTFDYVKDTDLPADTDTPTEWIFDVRARGGVANDLNAAGSRDNHGSSLVMLEYLRLAQNELYRVAKTPLAQQHTIGDATCFDQATAAVGCTGLEGALITGPKATGCMGVYTPATATTPSACASNPALTPAGLSGWVKQMAGTFFGIFGSFLKPGDPVSVICDQPFNAIAGDTTTCMSGSGDPINDPTFALWDGAYQRVINVFGKADVFNLPPAARDRRFFFQQYTLALTKYMKAYGAKSAVTPFVEPLPIDVANVNLDMENVFWDISDINQFDKIEYVERDFVDATHEPTNFEYGSDIKVANQRTTNWDRKMSRAERAMYQSLLGNGTTALGKVDNVRFTNMFGSDILPSLWQSVGCATTGTDPADPTCSASTLGAWDGEGDFHATGGLDSHGLPLLADYPGAWGNTIWHRGPSPVTITGYLNNVQAAKVSMPQYTNPYDQTSPVIQVVQALVPHTPAQPGVGVAIPITGTRDKVITAGVLSYVGNTSNYNVKYNFQTCKAEKLDLATACAAGQQQFICTPGLQPSLTSGDTISNDPGCKKNAATRKDGLDNYCCDGTARPAFIPTNSIIVQAIDTSDFLGDVFMCKDPITNDILRVRMYDSAQSVLDWLTAHPAATNACDIVVRYSPFNNYIDKIFARTYGVSLNISKSFGAGRVADAELWDPALLSQ
jgi:hypothetical protein